MTRRIRDLRNFGPVTERLLATVGITTPDDLHQAGAVDAYQRLVDTRPPRLTITMLWALAGALLDIDWRDSRTTPDGSSATSPQRAGPRPRTAADRLPRPGPRAGAGWTAS